VGRTSLSAGFQQTRKSVHQPTGFHLSTIRVQSRTTLADLENTLTHLQPTQSNIKRVLADRENARTHLQPTQSLIQPVRGESQKVVWNRQTVF